MATESDQFEIVQRAVFHPQKGIKLRVNNTSKSYWVNEELSFDSANDKMTGMDHFVGGIASSLVLAIIRDDNDHDHIIHQLEVRLAFKLTDPLSYIGVVGCEGEPRISKVNAVIYAVSLAEVEELKECINRALRRCVVYQTLRHCVHFNIRVKQVY